MLNDTKKFPNNEIVNVISYYRLPEYRLYYVSILNMVCPV